MKEFLLIKIRNSSEYGLNYSKEKIKVSIQMRITKRADRKTNSTADDRELLVGLCTVNPVRNVG
jgi:hypothetical protein